VPIASAFTAAAGLGAPDPFGGSAGWRARYGDAPVSQFLGAETMAQRWNLSRDDLEAYALESHRRALRAIEAGRFAAETAPLAGVHTDECPRPDT